MAVWREGVNQRRQLDTTAVTLRSKLRIYSLEHTMEVTLDGDFPRILLLTTFKPTLVGKPNAKPSRLASRRMMLYTKTQRVSERIATRAFPCHGTNSTAKQVGSTREADWKHVGVLKRLVSPSSDLGSSKTTYESTRLTKHVAPAGKASNHALLKNF